MPHLRRSRNCRLFQRCEWWKERHWRRLSRGWLVVCWARGRSIAKASSPKASRSCSVAACTACPLGGSSLFWTCSLGPRAPKPHSQGAMSTCPTALKSHGEGSRLADLVMKIPPEENTMCASFKVVLPSHTPRCQEGKPFPLGFKKPITDSPNMHTLPLYTRPAHLSNAVSP